MADTTRPESLMGVVMRAMTQVEAIAAVGAHLRVVDGELTVDPAIASRLAHVASLFDVPDAPEPQRRAAVGAIRAFLRQALDLVERPGNAGWTYDDPVVLDAQGRGSMVIASVIAAAIDALDPGRLVRPGARVLDIGSGTSWLSIAWAERQPGLEVVGLDTWGPALALARRNIAASAVADRVSVREQDVVALADVAAFDGAWFPAPFIGRATCVEALPRVVRALRPGGWIWFGLYGGSVQPLPTTLAQVRAIRSGGHPWTDDEAIALLREAGFEDVAPFDHGIEAPVRLVVGRTAREGDLR